MSAVAPESDLCKGLRSTSCATVCCAAFQIVHSSASECRVWFTKPSGPASGCPPQPSKTSNSMSFHGFRGIVPLGSKYPKRAIGPTARQLQRGRQESFSPVPHLISRYNDDSNYDHDSTG